MAEVPDRVCAVVARTRHKMMQVELREAARKAKFLEVRLDFLAKAVDFKRLLPFKGCAWLGTIRRPADGGRWPGSVGADQQSGAARVPQGRHRGRRQTCRWWWQPR